MKSIEQAQITFKNTCNNSSSKQQYSFAKSMRFNNKNILKKFILDKFYDLPSLNTQKGTIFSKSKKLQLDMGNNCLPPGLYNPKQVGAKMSSTFGIGRDKCKANSVFNCSTIVNPGPGAYSPQKLRSKSNISLGGRLYTSYQTQSPGPKYYFQSTLLNEKKILSGQKRSGSVKIIIPKSKSRKITINQEKPAISQSNTQGLLTYKGDKRLGNSGSAFHISRTKRFSSLDIKQVPSPGQYPVFSQFIAYPK